METSEQQISLISEEELQSCQRACRASQLPLPGSEEARAMTVGSGRQLSMLLEQSNPIGVFSRILLASSLWTNSEEYCYVWKRLDTRFACSAFQLTPLAQSTDGNGCSLWRTPDASIVSGGAANGEDRLKQGHALGLHDQVKTPKLWPTPDAGNFNDGENLETWEARKQRNKAKGINGNGQGTPLSIAVRLWPTPRANENDQGPANRKKIMEAGTWTGQGRGMTLSTAVKLWPIPTAQEGKHGAPSPGETIRKNGTIISVIGKIWPTQTARDWKSCSHGNQENSRPLSEAAGLTGSGSLNPEFVENLMGFPIGYTELK